MSLLIHAFPKPNPSVQLRPILWGGSYGAHFGFFWGSFWDHPGVILGSSRCHFDIIWGGIIRTGGHRRIIISTYRPLVHPVMQTPVSYTHLRAHETLSDL
eukprot:2108245-Karenia_brevis.AAC.1